MKLKKLDNPDFVKMQEKMLKFWNENNTSFCGVESNSI